MPIAKPKKKPGDRRFVSDVRRQIRQSADPPPKRVSPLEWREKLARAYAAGDGVVLLRVDVRALVDEWDAMVLVVNERLRKGGSAAAG